MPCGRNTQGHGVRAPERLLVSNYAGRVNVMFILSRDPFYRLGLGLTQVRGLLFRWIVIGGSSGTQCCLGYCCSKSRGDAHVQSPPSPRRLEKKMSVADLKARKRSDYGYHLDYRTRWYVGHISQSGTAA
jgi:hypothetical protein